MSDSKEDSNQEELEWLLFELDEAREDQRVSLDLVVLKVRYPGRTRESLRLQLA